MKSGRKRHHKAQKLPGVIISPSFDVTRPGLTSDVKPRLTGVEDADGTNLVEAVLRIGFIAGGQLVVEMVVGVVEEEGEEMCEKGDEGEVRGVEEEEREAGYRGKGDGARVSECEGVAPLLVMSF